MRRRNKVICSLVGMALALVSFSCSADKVVVTPTVTAPTPSTPRTSGVFPLPEEAGKYGGVIRVIRQYESDTIDPHQGLSITDLAPTQNLYNQLLQYNPFNPSEIISDLAKKWEVSPDGKVITFSLREDVRWHDGRPFTSADAEFSIKRMMNPPEGIRSPRKPFFTGVAGTESPDPQTFKITLQYPRASFLANLASGWFLMLPKHVLEEKGQKYPVAQATGTGPFKLKSWDTGVSIRLVRNGDYFVKGRPYLDGVEFHLVSDQATQFAALRTKRVEMTSTGSTGLIPSHFNMIKESPELAAQIDAIQYSSLLMPYFIFNLGKAPWSDVRVRRAAHLALNRQAMIAVGLGFGDMGILTNPTGPWSSPKEEILKTPGFRQPKDEDLAEAKRLIAEAGHPNGFETKVLLRAGVRTHEQMTSIFVDSLAKIGIRASMEQQEMVTFTKTTATRGFEVATYVYGRPIDDPDAVIFEQFVTDQFRNIGGYSNEKVDRLADEQSRMLDAAKRKTIVMEIQQELLGTSPVLFTYWVINGYGKWKTVHNFHPGIGNFNNYRYESVWLSG